MLTLVFGATAFATSTILAAFFAGLALGSFYFGRRVDEEDRSPLLLYALLEAGVGVFAFLMPVLFGGLEEIYVEVYRQFSPGFYQITAIRFVLSFAVLLVPATLLGGTLPVMVKFFADRDDRLGWDIGHLYSVNTFGAVAGAVLAGFFLILLLGVRESGYLAGGVNLLIAGAALLLDRRSRSPEAEVEKLSDAVATSGASAPAPQAGGDSLSPGLARIAVWAVGISGFCALALEVFWTRALVFYLDNSTHAFTTILTSFLLGIALGSFLVARFIDRRKRLFAWFGLTEILIGVSAVLTIPVLNALSPVFEAMGVAEVSVDGGLVWRWMGMRFAESLAVMLVPTVLMGMTLPMAAKIYARDLGAVGSALGDVYSVNTVGGVLGSAAAGFALIPVLGVQNGILAVGAISVGVGVLLLLSEPEMRRENRFAAVGGAGILVVAVALQLDGDAMVLTSYYERQEQQEILSYEEGIGATVKVFRDGYGERTLSVDGFPVAGTPLAAEEVQKSLAHLPLLLSNARSPKANVIGFGAGGTSWNMLQYDVEEVDVVELVPAVIDAAKWFPDVNHGVLRHPRFTLVRGDGRNYLERIEETYDIISIDATSPKMAGNGSLYSLEFYELLRKRLSGEGTVVQWIPLHLLSDREVRMIARTFQTAFPHTTLWFSPLRLHLILVGTPEELEIDFGALSRKMERPGVRRELSSLEVRGAVDALSWFVMGEEKVKEYASDARLNTDDHPYLEFTPAMAYFVADWFRLQNLANLAQHRESVLPRLTGLDGAGDSAAAVREAIRTRFEATDHSLRGDIYRAMGEEERARAEYRKALRIDPDERNWLNADYGRRTSGSPPAERRRDERREER